VFRKNLIFGGLAKPDSPVNSHKTEEQDERQVQDFVGFVSAFHWPFPGESDFLPVLVAEQNL